MPTVIVGADALHCAPRCALKGVFQVRCAFAHTPLERVIDVHDHDHAGVGGKAMSATPTDQTAVESRSREVQSQKRPSARDRQQHDHTFDQILMKIQEKAPDQNRSGTRTACALNSERDRN